MRLTIAYFYDFGPSFKSASLMNSEAWDTLRLDADRHEFALPSDRRQWTGECQSQTQARQSAEQIEVLAVRRNCSTIFSVGVGRGCVEYHLKVRCPTRKIICTEYSERVVGRLQHVFPECDAIQFFDMTSPTWPDLGGQALYLLHRVDTGLSDQQWRNVFANMARANATNVLVTATGFLTPRTLLAQGWRRSWARVRRRRLTFSGYIRTRAMFQTLWRPHYELDGEHVIGGLGGFLLRRVEATFR